jgi:methionine sulfoxide reductase heme-binding subunit
MDTWYLWVVQHRNRIVGALVGLNCLLVVLWYLAFQAIVMDSGNPAWFYANAKLFGQIALVLYVLTAIPGIMRRFGKFTKPVSLLMMFRRYIGIAMYLFVLLHGSVERLFSIMKGAPAPVTPVIFELFGTVASMLLIWMFLTSNDKSVNTLGKWWHRIHNLTYIVVWLIFVHVALQGLSIWTVLIGITSIAQLTSHIYAKQKKISMTV